MCTIIMIVIDAGPILMIIAINCVRGPNVMTRNVIFRIIRSNKYTIPAVTNQNSAKLTRTKT